MADDGRDQQQQNRAQIEAYSQRITRLRRILPIIAFLLLGLLVLAANPDFSRNGDKDDGGEGANNRLVIDRPQFNGRLPDGRAYRLTALQGVQKDNGDMTFSAAQMSVEAAQQKPSLFFTADEGFFQPQQPNQTGTALLAGNVVAQTGDGYELLAPKIEMNLRDALWQAEGGITMNGAGSALNAARLEADENNAAYRFHNIRMQLTPPDREAR